MAVYLWSSLTANQTVTFDPLVDQLVFDSGITSYKGLLTWDFFNSAVGTDTFFTDLSGKKVSFTGFFIDQITPSNLIFQGSTAGFLIGDLTTGAVDDPLANIITGTSSHDAIWGLGGNDILNGGDGDDLFFASGGGNDTIDGGNGFDWYQVSTTSLYGITANLKTGKVYYYDNGEVDTVASIEGVRGSMLDDTLIGNTFDNTFRGRAGEDFIYGGGGIDWVVYNEITTTQGTNIDLNTGFVSNDGYGTQDTLVDISNVRGSLFNDYIVGNYAANTLLGDAGDDILVGGYGDDILKGGQGNDTLYGYSDTLPLPSNYYGSPLYSSYIPNDVADYGDAAAGVAVNLSIVGSQNTIGAGNDTLVDINGIYGSGFNDTLSGNARDNRLFGGLGNDILNGGDGNDNLDGREGDDILNGGNGIDTAYYGKETAGVKVYLATVGAQNTVGSGMDTLVSIENVVGTAFNDTLYGNALANRITASAGNDNIHAGAGDDWIQGGAGNDYMIGFTGVDTADFTDATSALTVDLNIVVAQNTGGSGNDRLVGIENVTGSNFNDTLTGDANDNVLFGGSGDDFLIGGAGNDTLDGGYNTYSGILTLAPENDTVSYAAATSGITVNLNQYGVAQNIGGGQGMDILNNVENIIASAYDDTLWSGYNGGTLTAGAGNDMLIINSGNGNRVVDGGTGVDTLSLINYYNNNIGVTLDLNIAAAQTVATGYPLPSTQTFTITATNIENVAGSYGNDNLTGTAGNNIMSGGAGNDVLVGGAGIDTLNYGGTIINGVNNGIAFDNLTISLATTTAQVVSTGQGTDTVSGFENLIGGYGNDTLIGDAGSNVIEGGGGNDIINGGGSTDTASYASAGAGVTVDLANTGAQFTGGQTATDTLISIEYLVGSAYADNLTGNVLANALTGGAGNDTIAGAAGNDKIIGGVGADVLAGGAGADTFQFDAVTESVLGGTDTIVDFSSVDLDKINLYYIDANTAVAGNQAFTFIGSTDFSAAGQVRFDSATSTIYAEIDGNGVADFQLQLIGISTLGASDFLL
jgi:Ca2+-binding RTX toxin-like protein